MSRIRTFVCKGASLIGQRTIAFSSPDLLQVHRTAALRTAIAIGYIIGYCADHPLLPDESRELDEDMLRKVCSWRAGELS